MHAAEYRAGGTDLSERLRSGVTRADIVELPQTLVSSGIWATEASVHVGGMASIQSIADHATVTSSFPALAAAAGGLATPQVRNMATAGGNLAQRSRCWYYRNPHTSCVRKGGDTCPARTGNHLYGVIFDAGACVAPHPSTLGAAFMAYDATALTSSGRELAMEAFFGDGSDGRHDNRLEASELVTEVRVPTTGVGEWGAYQRATSRRFAEWPLVELVVRLVLHEGTVHLARIVAGGVAPMPMRLRGAEQALQGVRLTEAVVDRSVMAALEGVRPLPMTGYKVALLQGLVRDLLMSATRQGNV